MVNGNGMEKEWCVQKSAKKKKKIEDYQKHELAELVVALDAMEKVFDYYGGNLK